MPLPDPLVRDSANQRNFEALNRRLDVTEGTLQARFTNSGDYIGEDDTTGVVLASPDGHYWRVTIDNAGALQTTDLGTTRPD